jgi:hypothetical protein
VPDDVVAPDVSVHEPQLVQGHKQNQESNHEVIQVLYGGWSAPAAHWLQLGLKPDVALIQKLGNNRRGVACLVVTMASDL